VRTTLAGGGGGGGGALPNRTGGGGRPGENVSDITCLVAMTAAANALPVPLASPAGASTQLYVQSNYQPAEPFMLKFAGILHDLLSTIFMEVLLLPPELLRLVYMTTIRADTAIAGKGEGGSLFFNVMVCHHSAPPN
jgi:hypothetical protein